MDGEFSGFKLHAMIDFTQILTFFRDEMWGVLSKLTERLQRVDMLHFMTNDVASTLHKHFHDIRLASAKYVT